MRALIALLTFVSVSAWGSGTISSNCLKTLHSDPIASSIIKAIEESVKKDEISLEGAAAMMEKLGSNSCSQEDTSESSCAEEKAKIEATKITIGSLQSEGAYSEQGANMLLEKQDKLEAALAIRCP